MSVKQGDVVFVKGLRNIYQIDGIGGRSNGQDEYRLRDYFNPSIILRQKIYASELIPLNIPTLDFSRSLNFSTLRPQ